MDTAEQSELNPVGYFVRCDLLQAGDVLLTKSIGGTWKDRRISDAIADLTEGTYSHAAIWLPVAEPSLSDTLLLVESEDLGVGLTFLPSGHVEISTGEREFGYFLLGVKEAAIFRHPALASLEAGRLFQATRQLQEKEFHLPYSKLERLAGALGRFRLLRPQIAFVLRWIDRGDPRLVFGTFCSELVAKYFEILGVPLFDPPKKPEQWSPNDLSCVLDEQNDLLLPLSSVPSYKIQESLLPREEYLPRLVSLNSVTLRLAEQNRRHRDTFSMEPVARMLADATGQAAEDATFYSRRATAIGDEQSAERLEQTAVSLRFAEAIAKQVLTRSARTGSADTNRSAEMRLLRIATDIMSKGMRDLSRRKALLEIKLVRTAILQRGRTWSLMRSLSKVRRTWLRLWKESARPVGLARTSPLPQPSSEELAIVDGLLDRALTAVTSGCADQTKQTAWTVNATMNG